MMKFSLPLLVLVLLLVVMAVAPSVSSSSPSPSPSVSDSEWHFDLSLALQSSRHRTLSFSFWAAMPTQQAFNITRTIDLFEFSAAATASEICDELLQSFSRTLSQSQLQSQTHTHSESQNVFESDSSSDYKQKYRCLMPVLMRLRLAKLHVISSIAREYELPYDEEAYGLLAGYDELGVKGEETVKSWFDEESSDIEQDVLSSSISVAEKGGLTACIIGTPTVHTILPALLTSGVSRVFVFSSLLDIEEEDDFKEAGRESCKNMERTMWNFYYANEAALVLGKEIEYVSLRSLLEDYQNNENDSAYLNICALIQLNPEHSLHNLSEAVLKSPSDVISLQELILHLGIIESARLLSIETTSFNYRDHNDFIDVHYSMVCNALTLVHIPFASSNPEERLLDIHVGVDSVPALTFIYIGSMNPTRSYISPNSVDKRCIVILITASFSMFFDNVIGLQHLLKYVLGYQHVYISPEVNWHVLEFLRKRADQLGGILVHIPVSSMDFLTLFSRNSIVYNSEQVFSSIVFGCGLSRMRSLIDNFLFPLWTYDSYTFEHFQNSVFDGEPELQKRIHIAPYVYSPSKISVLEKVIGIMANETPAVVKNNLPIILHRNIPMESYTIGESNTKLLSSEDIEVLNVRDVVTFQDHVFATFIGSSTERRKHFTSVLERKFFESHLSGALPDYVKFYNLCSGGMFDSLRDYYLMKAKIVLNIASSNISILETHRINYLLSLGMLVVSEKGADAAIAAVYEGAVIFTNGADEMFEVTSKLLMNHTARDESRQRLIQFYKDTIEVKFVKQLDNVLNLTLQQI